jgi:hypothetical protein
MKTRGYAFPLLTLLCCSLLVSFGLNTQLRDRMDRTRSEAIKNSSESASFRWHPLLFRLLTFGHVPSAVDALLIRFLADDNISHVKANEVPEIYRILDLATDLDPAFFDLYASGGNFLAVVRNDRASALNLLEKGMRFIKEELPKYPPEFVERHWVQRWRIPFALGYLHLFEFQNMPAAIRAYEEMKEIDTTPAQIRNRADRIRTPEAQFQIGMNTLSLMKGWHKEDPEMLKEIDKKERILLLAKDLYFWNRGFEEYRRSNPRADLLNAFESFRRIASMPSRDLFGAEFFVDSKTGRIDSRTEKVPVLGIQSDFNLPGERAIVKPSGDR